MTISPGSEVARALFPITQHAAYLDHAAVSPLNVRTAQAVQDWIDARMHHGHPPAFADPDLLPSFRRRAAAFFNAHPDEIAFTRNTSEGLLLVARGLPWREGDNLVTAETEFTANVYPWRNLEALGVEIRRVPARNGRIDPRDIVAAMDARTRLLALSYVEFFTGYRNPIADLAEEAHRRNVLICVDVIQAAGVLPIDVQAMEIDFMAAGGPKWLMGPLGAGIFYVRRDLLDMLDPRAYGWLGTADPMNFFDYEMPLSPTASRYEHGTLAWPSLVGLMESMALLSEVGVPHIAAHVLDLTGRLIEALHARGMQVITPHAHDDERAGIVTFQHPRMPAEQVWERLKAADVHVSVRGPGIRVSPHFYNTWADIERLLAVLDELKA